MAIILTVLFAITISVSSGASISGSACSSDSDCGASLKKWCTNGYCVDPVVVECGDGWFSKIDGTRVNAKQICRDHEYGGKITEYGGNWGVQCVHGSNGAGGSLTAFGPAVSWKCDVDGQVNEYDHRKNQACQYVDYKVNYPTVESAKRACDNLGNGCMAVQDEKCDNATVNICRTRNGNQIRYDETETIRSCVYVKPKVTCIVDDDCPTGKVCTNGGTPTSACE